MTSDTAPVIPLARLIVFSCSTVKLLQLRLNCDWGYVNPTSACKAALDVNPTGNKSVVPIIAALQQN